MTVFFSSALGIVVSLALFAAAWANGVALEQALYRAALAGGVATVVGGFWCRQLVLAARKTELQRIQDAEQRQREEAAKSTIATEPRKPRTEGATASTE